MEMDWSESRRERSEERYHGGSPIKEPEEGAFDDSEQYDKERSRDLSRHRSKDKKKSRKEEKDHRSRDRDRSKTNDDSKEREKEVKDSEKERASSKEKRKEDREDHEKHRTKHKLREKDDRDKHRAKDHDRDKDEKDRGRKHDRERERENETESSRGQEKERGKEKGKDKEKEKEGEKEKAKDRDRGKDREKDKEKERTRDREKERDHERNRDRDIIDREQAKDSVREREREMNHGKERSRDREKMSRRSRDDHDHYREEGKHSKAKAESDDYKDRETSKQGKTSLDEDNSSIIKQGDSAEDLPGAPSGSQVEFEQSILKMKEERLGKKSESVSEVLSWVNRSRKLEKEKALQRSRIFEEQDNFDEDENEGDTTGKETLGDTLAGVKVLHGLDKILDGGSVILTLKDHEILANGDINEDVDMLENVEIGEQKRRSEAYKAAKKNTGTYDDKFSDEPGAEKKMLPQYDDPAEEEGVTLGAGGRFTAEAEKKLEELRRRLQGTSVKNQVEDLNLSAKISSDYYTSEEMLQFKKPKKKKSLRKKEKLDIDALEAEARSAGLGDADLGSRNDSKRQAAREEQERSEAERRNHAYQAAYAKAEEASRALRMEQELTSAEENDTPVLTDDAEDLQKSLERTRKLALKKQNEKAVSGPEAIARLASSIIKSQPADAQNTTSGEADNKVVFTEMEEFVWGLQLDEEAKKTTHEDVFEEDEAPKALEEKKDETGGWAEVINSGKDEQSRNEDKEEVVPDATIHEAPVGKGLSGVLKLLKDRGSLKETIEWGGRNMDKKKSKLAGIHDDEGPKEIHLERTDEYGRILTPKEAFRLISHKFHGKGPGKMKQEKRMKQYYDELKLKQMTSSDVLPQSVERMREAQAQLKTPYLVLSGQVKPGQTSDPRSGFATVEKKLPGSLTPMLGDKKVEHFLGIKRKGEPGSTGTAKKPKP